MAKIIKAEILSEHPRDKSTNYDGYVHVQLQRHENYPISSFVLVFTNHGDSATFKLGYEVVFDLMNVLNSYGIDVRLISTRQKNDTTGGDIGVSIEWVADDRIKTLFLPFDYWHDSALAIFDVPRDALNTYVELLHSYATK